MDETKQHLKRMASNLYKETSFIKAKLSPKQTKCLNVTSRELLITRTSYDHLKHLFTLHTGVVIIIIVLSVYYL